MKRLISAILLLSLCFGLCACGAPSGEELKKQAFDAAAALLEEGKFEEAMAAFEQMEAYEGAAEMIEKCRAGIQESEYSAALALMSEGRYEEAMAALEQMDGYKDSRAQIEACLDALKDTKYNEALALMAEEKFAEAAALFKGLDYQDSAEKYEECRATSPYDFTEVGDIITFGRYEQDQVKENGADPLTWRVLDKQDGKVLIITEHLIDELPYHAIYWKHSPINGFLNGSFLNDFTPEEKAMLVKIRVQPDPHPDAPDTDQGSSFEEKVFLLSVDEAEKYFADDADRVSDLTAYTIWFGDFDEKYGAKPGDSYPWWLRTAYWNGSSSASIAAVDENGRIIVKPHWWNCALRPACWIQLEEAGE